MSAEITLTAALAVDDGKIADVLSKAGIHFDWTTHKYFKGVQTIGTSEEALQLGEVSSLGYALIINLDTTNYVELRTGTGATKFARLDANGGLALFKFGSGITAPFAIADTASCDVAILLLST